jgi:hypothetical protein
MKLTPEQTKTLENLRKRWFHIGEPDHLPREQCVIVAAFNSTEAFGRGEPTMVIGIEADGYAHT